MISESLKNEIIHLRATGISHEKIATKLNLTKLTVIKTSKNHSSEIEEQREFINKEVLKSLAGAKIRSHERIAHLVDDLFEELGSRSLSTLKTETLFSMLLKSLSEIREINEKIEPRISTPRLVIDFN